MPKKKIIILGGGISGLTLAYDLAKHYDRFDITLIEKSDHVGGWVDTDTSTGFFFEKGPRVFRGSRSPDFLALTREIGLHSELIESSKEGQARYLWREGKLRKAPVLSWGLVQGLIKEWRAAPSSDDESVWDFAHRRFNATVARDLFDPLVVGIFGGDPRELSIRACFPLYKKWEEEHGSVLKGLLCQKRFKGPYMFGFQRGMKSVVERLREKAPIPFQFQEEVVSITPDKQFTVRTSKNVYQADFLFSALPAPVIGKLLVPELARLKMQSATIVDLGYHKSVLKQNGFGYLVASGENEDVLGCVFNSNTFPHYNQSKGETRLTVKLKTAGDPRSRALKALSKHLGITATPDVSHVTHAPDVFPQYLVGHHTRMQNLESELKKKFPNFYLVGNYLYGVGVNDCIARARSVAASFLSENPS